jgi:hypothetical protein
MAIRNACNDNELRDPIDLSKEMGCHAIVALQ